MAKLQRQGTCYWLPGKAARGFCLIVLLAFVFSWTNALTLLFDLELSMAGVCRL